MKSIISGVVKEGDILVIEGGVPRHIIVPKRRTDVIAGAYAAVIAECPSTVYIDAKEVTEEDLPNIEEIARRKLMENMKANARLLQEAVNEISKVTSSKANIKSTKQGANDGNKDNNGSNTGAVKASKDDIKVSEKKEAEGDIAKVNVKVLSLSEPESGPESEPVIVAEVEGPKGKFKVVARGKHAERLIALEGQTACLWMGRRINSKYGAYEAKEVHFSMKRAVVDTKVSCIDGNYTAEAKEGNQVTITAFDVETIQKLDGVANTEQKVRLVLEHSEASPDSFVVTDVLPIETKTQEAAPVQKAS